MRSFSVAVFALVLAISGCAPDALQGFESDGGNANNINNANNSNNANNNNGDMGTMGTPSAEFTAVVGIFSMSCASLACHGAASNNSLSVAASEAATPSEVFDALRDTTPTADGELLVVPSDPTTSNVVTRMSLMPTGDLREMPQGIGSPMEDIMAFETWITNGATFN